MVRLFRRVWRYKLATILLSCHDGKRSTNTYVGRDGRFARHVEDPPLADPPRTSFDTTVGAAVGAVVDVPPASAFSVSPEVGSPASKHKQVNVRRDTEDQWD